MLETIKLFAIDELEQFEGREVYACDLGYDLTNCINCTGSVTCSTYEATEWIKENFNELGDVVDSYEDYYGDPVCNPFHEPEKFQVLVYIHLVNGLLNACEFITDNWDEQIELTKENIETLVNQIKAVESLEAIL